MLLQIFETVIRDWLFFHWTNHHYQNRLMKSLHLNFKYLIRIMRVLGKTDALLSVECVFKSMKNQLDWNSTCCIQSGKLPTNFIVATFINFIRSYAGSVPSSVQLFYGSNIHQLDISYTDTKIQFPHICTKYQSSLNHGLSFPYIKIIIVPTFY